jgi:hypothetical protein
MFEHGYGHDVVAGTIEPHREQAASGSDDIVPHIAGRAEIWAELHGRHPLLRYTDVVGDLPAMARTRADHRAHWGKRQAP